MIAQLADSKNIWCTIQVLLVLVCVQPLMASPSYGVWVVDTTHSTHEPIIADVDGDGLKDLVVPQYFPKTGRELHIYLQETNERLSNSPLKIEVKSEAIGFALADVRETPGTEILWITADGVYSYSANVQSYVGNLEHLSDWDLFIRHPDSKELLYVEASDLNNDGAPDLVLPGSDRYGVFLNNGGVGLDLVGTIALPKSGEFEMPNPVSSRGFERSLYTNTVTEVDDEGKVSLKNVFIPRSQYHHLFAEEIQDTLRTSTITYGSWQSGVIPRDIDGDGHIDLMIRTPSGLRISHLRSNPTTTYTDERSSVEGRAGFSSSNNLVTYEIPYKGKPVWSLEDVDGDGDLDIVSIDSNIMSSTVHLMVNDKGQFNEDEVNQVIRVNGTIVRLEFSALRENESPLMLINTVTAPLRKILTEIELHRNFLLFERDETNKGVFNRKPSLTSTQSINVDSLRNLMPSTLQFDLDSDGSNDILECKSDGSVQALRIDRSTRIASEPFWQFTPEFAVFSANTSDLNNDHLPDLILKHSTAVTYLISRR